MAEYTPESIERVATDLEDLVGVVRAAAAVEILRDVAATLRQQAGRVDEGVRDLIEDWRAAANAHDKLSYACCGDVGRRCADELEAALAQNTQGDGEAVALNELRSLWPRWRQLVDGFVDSEHWNTGWDAETRQSMIDWGLKWLAGTPEVSRG